MANAQLGSTLPWTPTDLLPTIANAQLGNPLPWTPPDFPPTTAENDGTLGVRYDVRQTLAYVDERTENVNNVFVLWWITTTEGHKYHLTSNAGLIGSDRLGTFISLNDLTENRTRGASAYVPGSGNPDHLDLRSDLQNITSPADGDRWTNTHFTLDLADIRLNATFNPTGTNFYYAGNGGIQLRSRGTISTYAQTVPGWSWYWANPTTRINGTMEIDGRKCAIDPEQSYALFERQWGDFTSLPDGYYALWFYLESGEVLISWSLKPDMDGKSKNAFASVWHPSGLHETIPVGSKSKAWDISTGESGKKYFNSFWLDLPARKASFRFDKWFRNGELTTTDSEKPYITISESYGEGIASWNGNEVRFHGHVEQLSALE